jgi:hypothetical protein
MEYFNQSPSNDQKAIVTTDIYRYTSSPEVDMTESIQHSTIKHHDTLSLSEVDEIESIHKISASMNENKAQPAAEHRFSTVFFAFPNWESLIDYNTLRSKSLTLQKFESSSSSSIAVAERNPPSSQPLSPFLAGDKQPYVDD